jgi:hypothetical protein
MTAASIAGISAIDIISPAIASIILASISHRPSGHGERDARLPPC